MADLKKIGTWSKNGYFGSVPDKVIDMYVSVTSADEQPVGMVMTVRAARALGQDVPFGADEDLLYISVL